MRKLNLTLSEAQANKVSALATSNNISFPKAIKLAIDNLSLEGCLNSSQSEMDINHVKYDKYSE